MHFMLCARGYIVVDQSKPQEAHLSACAVCACWHALVGTPPRTHAVLKILSAYRATCTAVLELETELVRSLGRSSSSRVCDIQSSCSSRHREDVAPGVQACVCVCACVGERGAGTAGTSPHVPGVQGWIVCCKRDPPATLNNRREGRVPQPGMAPGSAHTCLHVPVSAVCERLGALTACPLLHASLDKSPVTIPQTYSSAAGSLQFVHPHNEHSAQLSWENSINRPQPAALRPDGLLYCTAGQGGRKRDRTPVPMPLQKACGLSCSSARTCSVCRAVSVPSAQWQVIPGGSGCAVPPLQAPCEQGRVNSPHHQWSWVTSW